MNTIRTAVFLIAMALSGGCASVVPEGSGVDCAGASVRVINIVYKRHSKITVAPPRLVLDAGEAIDYRVKGPVSRNFSAKGTSGPGPYGWLDITGGSGGPGGVSNFKCVPADQASGDYNYEIEIDGVGKLDPIVQVR